MQWVIVISLVSFGMSPALGGMVSWGFSLIISCFLFLFAYYSTKWCEEETNRRKEFKRKNKESS